MKSSKLDASTAKLVIRVFADRPPRQLDALYLFGQTTDNEKSEFERAREWVNRVGVMVIPDGPAANGYLGGEIFANKVKAFYDGTVIRMPLVGSEITNTLAEARGLVTLSLRSGWRDVGLCSFPSHQLRGVMTVISAAMDEDSDRKIRFWSVPGIPLRWDEEVVHSQGELVRTRSELLDTELERIKNYNNIRPPEEILAWMDNR